MKRKIILLSLLISASTLFAEFKETQEKISKGGFLGPSISKTTIKKAITLNDDIPVKIEGKIIQHLGKDKYLFRDSSGDITIEIDHDKWRGITVEPNDTVIIDGEIDKDWNSIKIDVESIIKK